MTLCGVKSRSRPSQLPLKPKIAPCTIRVIYTHWGNLMYSPLSPPTFRRCSLACSSDQKNIDFLQKPSMILGSNFCTSTIGTYTNGSVSLSPTLYFRSLSISIWIGSWQCPHSVLMINDNGSPLNRPCTKGVAIASIAQAALTCSPVLKVMRCGV